MTDRLDNALRAHVAECEDCRADAARVGQLAARLDANGVDIDASRLSCLALAAAAPELQARAQAAFWRRLVRALAAALVPLPLVVAADVWWLGRVYDVAAAWVPASLAADFVLSYAVSLLVLIGSAYAAIPLLLARPIRAPEPDPAAA
jgi:hypothetical protein